ncbi:hypothetical protein EON67_00850 [archaeon]|nr:MAG: hypothetical protein EON67_00850 [archaeon]
MDAEYAEEDGSVRVNAVSSTPGRIEIVTVPVFERLTVDKQAYYTMVSVLALTLIVVSYRQWFAALSANKPVSAKRR